MLTELASSNKVVGVKQSRKAVRDGRAVKLFLAQDADPAITQPLIAECTQRGIPVDCGSNLTQIGHACGITVGAAVAALLK
ncbi:MAG: ribosomal L7Ae/L30e/S12e/Gadd45 family protein [Oscillibacter sp.]|nr:ribosomal L7Ae/L30e/S12e/Gadd45 family protein [Oscillibacter sp.]